MRKISLDLVRVTEAAAIAGSRWIGSYDKIKADKDATDAMRDRLNRLDFAAKIVIGEGEKDESYGLFKGEKVGRQSYNTFLPSSRYEIAVDPIDGTRPTVEFGPEAMSTIAVSHKGSFYTTNKFYMKKMVVGPSLKQYLKPEHIDDIGGFVKFIVGKFPERKICVCVLDRPRNNTYISAIRRNGGIVKLIQDCDVSGAIATCLPRTGVHVYYGIGGSPEGVLGAASIKCLGGDMLAQEVSNLFSQIIVHKGNILHLNDLVSKDCVFTATGITDGFMLRGVKKDYNNKFVTNSVFMRSISKTVRWIEAVHGN